MRPDYVVRIRPTPPFGLHGTHSRENQLTPGALILVSINRNVYRTAPYCPKPSRLSVDGEVLPLPGLLARDGLTGTDAFRAAPLWRK